MRRVLVAVLLICSLVSMFASGSVAQPALSAPGDEWVRLGAIELERLGTRDALEIDEPNTVYKSIRLEAKRGEAVITRVQVVWQDAPLHTEDRTINLKAGERTRPISIALPARGVTRVGLVYQVPAHTSPGARPLIEIWALKAAVSPSAVAQTAAGRLLIATQSFSFASGQVAINPTSGPQRLSRIRLKPLENDVFVEEVRVSYTEGDPDVVSIGRNLPINVASEWLELKSDRFLRQIDLIYKARPAFRGQVRLEIHGEGAARDLVAADRRVARSARAVPGSPCITETVCTPVPIFFGTNRQRKDQDGRIQFVQDRGDATTLGQATVTVPRAYRKKGEIPRPSWWDLARLANPYTEDPARHFTILNAATKVYASEDEFIAAVKAAMAEPGVFKDHAFVFVHGFNVSFENALYRTAQIAYDLGQDDVPFGTAFLYSWPSAGEIESYVYDLESAEKAVPHLQAFIDLVLAKTGAQHVHLIAHSMGNAPLLAALSNIAARNNTRTTINQVILAAPDVDAKDFAELSARILPIAKTLTLYASSQDRAILASRKIRRDLPRAGDVINGVPVIVSGLDTIDVSTISTAIFGLNHAAYADKKELLNDMRRLMLTGERPPDVRDISMRKVTQPATFWRFTR